MDGWESLVATGTASRKVAYHGTVYEIGQANNSLVFPGMGLAVAACRAKKVSPGMLAAAAHALADLVDMKKPGASVLPPVREMGNFTKILAEKVVCQAVKEGLNRVPVEDPKKPSKPSNGRRNIGNCKRKGLLRKRQLFFCA